MAVNQRPPEVQGLNPNQEKAVLATNGRVLILAGAGSGKTKVLTVRMAHLIKNLGVSPSSILGLTFTNKAAAEMRQRIAKMIDGKLAKKITLCTFHSFCMKVLRNDIDKLGYTTSFTLWDEHDVKRMVSLIARDILKSEGEMPSLGPTLAAINQARSKGIRAEEINETGSKWHDDFTCEIYRRLMQSMRAYNALDFDALIWMTVELFEQFPAVLDKYQEQYKYVMIDEYQDTNPVQYRLAELLTRKHNNLCVVGDDDQSIYGWRGAEVKNILDFADAITIKLEQNYRSTNVILNAANAVICNNNERHDKVLWSEHGEGSQIEVFNAPDDVSEAQAVICRIAKMKKQHALKWKDFAILYRSNALSRQFELALMKHTWDDHGRWVQGVPYQVHGGTEFYGRREIKDLMAYLRIIVNDKDQEAILRVINQPRRGIGEGALDKLTMYNRKHQTSLWSVLETVCSPEGHDLDLGGSISLKAQNGVAEFVAIIKGARRKFEEVPLSEAMQWLVEKINYQRAIHEEVKSAQMRAFKWENVQEFVNAIAEYEQQQQAEDKEATIQNFVTDTPIQSDWESKNNEGGEVDKVNLLTFHSSKGLEFPVCFLVGVEDQIIPHEKSMMETGIEEERRLMYVAITRAMRFLVVSMARQRKRMGKVCASTPSRFLIEVPKEYLKVTRWDDVD
ncbi:MAG: UvrD-helicase domain-containing protein [Chlamydiota bacterium]|nr:UvrD-helicase domain-containing protein [Chlamydiota bacterium]